MYPGIPSIVIGPFTSPGPIVLEKMDGGVYPRLPFHMFP
jgi:hypothetical protein